MTRTYTTIRNADVSMATMERAAREGVDAFFLGCALALLDSPAQRQRGTGLHFNPYRYGTSDYRAYRDGYSVTAPDPEVNEKELEKVEALF